MLKGDLLSVICQHEYLLRGNNVSSMIRNVTSVNEYWCLMLSFVKETTLESLALNKNLSYSHCFLLHIGRTLICFVQKCFEMHAIINYPIKKPTINQPFIDDV